MHDTRPQGAGVCRPVAQEEQPYHDTVPGIPGSRQQDNDAATDTKLAGDHVTVSGGRGGLGFPSDTPRR